jgi:hypothetical protein
MDTISVFRGSKLTWVVLAGALLAGALGSGPANAAGPPPPDVAIKLRDGRYLHLAPLPFGGLAAVPVGAARFDGSGTRAVLLATFPGGAIRGEWRSASPTFAYLVDAERGTLTQLSNDGYAVSVAWSGVNAVTIREAARQPFELAVAGAGGGALPVGRFRPGSDVPDGSAYVSPKTTDRFAVFRAGDGRYVVQQVGARRFRIGGVASNGAYAVIGSYLAWIDGQRHIAHQVARFGPDLVEPLSFAGSPYGDALVPILPLGSPVYQAAYRNSVAYFSFSYGVQRIVAATNDLVNFWFPTLPHDPLFTVGDGLGASPDGALYFFRPEEDTMLFTRSGHYVRAHMTGLDAARDEHELHAALHFIDPTEDALHAALLEWRFYPVGDASGQRWVASRLGHLLSGDRAGHFSLVNPPRFPFALLGRTDDGRLWGASPLTQLPQPMLARGAADAGGPAVVAPAAPPPPGSDDLMSALWSSRDGVTWQRVGIFHGDIGAIGSHAGQIWIAVTQRWHGHPMISVARIDSADPQWKSLLPTGGTYGGEQLSFADLAGGFYLLWGATPGRRLAGEGGPLSAFRIDALQLAALDTSGENIYTTQRLEPDTDPSMPALGDQVAGATDILAPAFARARPPEGRWRFTIVTNVAVDPAESRGMTIMSPDQERAYELKYAGKPYPLETVTVGVLGDEALAARSIEFAPLHATGQSERWIKTPAGGWRLAGVLSQFDY